MRYLPLALLLVACGSDPSPSAAVDAAPRDVPGLDVAVDVAAVVDAATDTASDATETPDAVPDAAVDAPEVPRDASPEITTNDAVADVFRDASVDGGPLEARATAVSVSVRSDTVSWVTARAQSCAVTGGTLSVGADFDRPESTSFTVVGPVAGPVTLTMIAGGSGVSDVRATVSTGARYYTDGDTVQRTNVIVRGTPPGGVLTEITALGCVVR